MANVTVNTWFSMFKLYVCLVFWWTRYHTSKQEQAGFWLNFDTNREMWSLSERLWQTDTISCDNKYNHNKNKSEKNHAFSGINCGFFLVFYICSIYFFFNYQKDKLVLSLRLKPTNWLCIIQWFFSFVLHKNILTLCAHIFFFFVRRALVLRDFCLTNETGSDSCKFYFIFFFCLLSSYDSNFSCDQFGVCVCVDIYWVLKQI